MQLWDHNLTQTFTAITPQYNLKTIVQVSWILWAKFLEDKHKGNMTSLSSDSENFNRPDFIDKLCVYIVKLME